MLRLDSDPTARSASPRYRALGARMYELRLYIRAWSRVIAGVLGPGKGISGISFHLSFPIGQSPARPLYACPFGPIQCDRLRSHGPGLCRQVIQAHMSCEHSQVKGPDHVHEHEPRKPNRRTWFIRAEGEGWRSDHNFSGRIRTFHPFYSFKMKLVVSSFLAQQISFGANNTQLSTFYIEIHRCK